MKQAARRQRLLQSVRSLPGLGMRYHEALGESERQLLLAALADRRSATADVADQRSPGLKKCKALRPTPMSMQLEMFARSVSRVR